MNYMPWEIWADLLEDQGEDTSALRAWLEIGARGSQGYPISHSYGDEQNTGDWLHGFGSTPGAATIQGNSQGYVFEEIIAEFRRFNIPLIRRLYPQL